ncbi:MAG TPA: pantoate--beta-alanine ligase [Bryobacteraceae bacterium]|nr:pantoate--beta-alanine ligase [Bryobacteraceae bacterium]
MNSEVIDSIAALRRRLLPARASGRVIGFVPTMGALHRGHLRLVEEARKQCNVVVASIFVNPIQFNQTEDYALYPRTLDHDVQQCSAAGVHIVFAPGTTEMYPSPLSTFVEVPSVSEHLCGAFRPGHFRGVATVVMKLFQIVQPDYAYFGEKDAQQLAVIRRMVRDLDVPVAIVPVPTVREADGLALSSRNQRLTPEDRRVAPMLFRALEIAQTEGRESALAYLATEPRFRVEYLEAVDPDEMQPVDPAHRPVRFTIAAWLGPVRLIDNVLAV